MLVASSIIVAHEVGVHLQSAREINDLIGATYGAEALILSEHDLAPEFFDLKRGLLGELFQKLVNYEVLTAFIVAEPSKYGERFAELAFEHATHQQIRFVRSSEEAKAWLETRIKGSA